MVGLSLNDGVSTGMSRLVSRLSMLVIWALALCLGRDASCLGRPRVESTGDKRSWCGGGRGGAPLWPDALTFCWGSSGLVTRTIGLWKKGSGGGWSWIIWWIVERCHACPFHGAIVQDACLLKVYEDGCGASRRGVSKGAKKLTAMKTGGLLGRTWILLLMAIRDLPEFATNLPDVFDTSKACIRDDFDAFIPPPVKLTKAQLFLHKLLDNKVTASIDQLWQCSQALWADGAVRDTAEALTILLRANLGVAARYAAHHVMGRILWGEESCAHYEKIIATYLEPPLTTVQIMRCDALILSRILDSCSIAGDPSVIIEELVQLLGMGHSSPIILGYLNVFARKLGRVDILRALMVYYEPVDRAKAFRTARDVAGMAPGDVRQRWICTVMALEVGDRVHLAKTCSGMDRSIEGRLFHGMAFCAINQKPQGEQVMQVWRNLLMRLDAGVLRRGIMARLRRVSHEDIDRYKLPDEVDATIVLLNEEEWLNRVERILLSPK